MAWSGYWREQWFQLWCDQFLPTFHGYTYFIPPCIMLFTCLLHYLDCKSLNGKVCIFLNSNFCVFSYSKGKASLLSDTQKIKISKVKKKLVNMVVYNLLVIYADLNIHTYTDIFTCSYTQVAICKWIIKWTVDELLCHLHKGNHLSLCH